MFQEPRQPPATPKPPAMLRPPMRAAMRLLMMRMSKAPASMFMVVKFSKKSHVFGFPWFLTSIYLDTV